MYLHEYSNEDLQQMIDDTIIQIQSELSKNLDNIYDVINSIRPLNKKLKRLKGELISRSMKRDQPSVQDPADAP